MLVDAKLKAEGLATGKEEPIMSTSVARSILDPMDKEISLLKEQKAPLVSASSSASSISLGSRSLHENITECKKDCVAIDQCAIEDDEERKSSAHLKNQHVKKKIKVDWTPELHGQFVKAVEQLGLDKAVPSKILELMGTNCLTRHNVASHLQKYRTQQKNLLAREAEVATLRQRRQVYGTPGRTEKQDANPWIVPTTGFPSLKSMHRSTTIPLHVWGYPSVSQSWSYMWPNPQAYSPQPPPAWAPAPVWAPPMDHSSWYYYHQDVIASGSPCFPHHSSMAHTTQTVTGVPPTSMYKVDTSTGIPIVPPAKSLPQPSFDSYPSKESIDTVIGDVLSKPWLPLPLGLKPPSIDSILIELQHQGISKIPSDCAT